MFNDSQSTLFILPTSPPAAIVKLIVASSTICGRRHCDDSHAIMSQFRAAKLDIGCFAKIRNIRDHTKRKVYMENEPERYAPKCIACTNDH